jgi:ankyrin repeat protein
MQYSQILKTALIYTNDAFVLACQYGYIQIVRYFLDQGGNTDIGVGLMRATEEGYLEIVELLLTFTSNRAFPDFALSKAARRGHSDIVRFLLSKGADVASLSGESLRFAIENNHPDVVRILLENGAELKEGLITTAVAYGHTEIVRLLLNRGLDIRQFDNYGLFRAVENGYIEMVRYLLDHGIPVLGGEEWILRLLLSEHRTDTQQLVLDRLGIQW